MSTIFSIVYRPKDEKYIERPNDFIRAPIERATLIAGHGIEGDHKAGHNPLRQLNLLSLEWLNALQTKGYKTQPGKFGEQIIISGLAVENLAPGIRLKLGNEACIEITKPRTGCERLEAVQGTAIKGLGPIGVMAKIIASGQISIGDTVRLIEFSDFQ